MKAYLKGKTLLVVMIILSFGMPLVAVPHKVISLPREMVNVEQSSKQQWLPTNTNERTTRKEKEILFLKSIKLFRDGDFVLESSREQERWASNLVHHSKNVPRNLSPWTKKADEVFLPVKKVMQNPELPNGCEITSLTSVLNYYGYNASKTSMADQYLPKRDFTYVGEERFGPNPNEYYVGDPRLQPGGWYSYAPPILTAANTYLDEQGSNKKAYDISGSSKDELISYIKNSVPVVTWITLDLSPPEINSHWYLLDTNEYYAAITNLHVVVLNGIKDDKVHVMNPLIGQVTYNAELFFNSYEEMGKHAVVVY